MASSTPMAMPACNPTTDAGAGTQTSLTHVFDAQSDDNTQKAPFVWPGVEAGVCVEVRVVCAVREAEIVCVAVLDGVGLAVDDGDVPRDHVAEGDALNDDEADGERVTTAPVGTHVEPPSRLMYTKSPPPLPAIRVIASALAAIQPMYAGTFT